MWHRRVTTLSTNDRTKNSALVNSYDCANRVGAERRSKPRLEGAFPTVVHGVDVSSETFQINTTIDNITRAASMRASGRSLSQGRLFSS